MGIYCAYIVHIICIFEYMKTVMVLLIWCSHDVIHHQNIAVIYILVYDISICHVLFAPNILCNTKLSPAAIEHTRS